MAEGSSEVPIPVVVMGLGAVGQAIARAALEKPELDVVAAIDPAHAGKRLSDVLGVPTPPVEVSADAARAFARAREGGVVLHATGSRLTEVLPQLERAVKAGLHVVSTCEELAYPWNEKHGDAAERLGRLCEAHDVAVVGTGVNPGFALDRLPSFLALATGPVRHVRALRVQDAAGRRPALLRKIGAGLSRRAFEAAEERGEVGHLGLTESALLVADGCGFDLELVEVEEDITPLLAEEDAAGPVPIRAGQVAGVHQTARAFVDGAERVRLELVLQVGAERPRDEVELDARPPVRATIEGGLPGEEATAWAVVHAAPAVVNLHGLITVLELGAGR